MSTGKKVLLGFLFYAMIVILAGVLLGSEGKNEEFQPQNEFRLDPWIEIKLGFLDLSINKAVMYLIIAAALTIVTMIWIANRMQRDPNKIQMTMEVMYDLTKTNIAGSNLHNQKMVRRWFPFLAALFFFIWFSNLLGYIPLPTNTEHTINVLGAEIPSFAIYSATANISIPLALALVVWVSYHVEGIRAKGFFPYFASWLPSGLESMNPFGKAAIFSIEVISHLVRPISLSVRLFANILAGHLLILFMGGGLAVLLGLTALGVVTFPLAVIFFAFEVGLVATLQAFIFSTLTAIYLGGATAESH